MIERRILVAATAGVALTIGGCLEPATATPDPVSALVVTPTTLALIPDDSAPLNATASTSTGTPLTSARIAWYSSDTTVARVNASGEVRAVRPGIATITALAGSRKATAQVTSTYPPLAGIRLYAHRAFGGAYPENTIVAVDSALAHGADGIEVDVQLTSDSVPVIIHDKTVDRTTNGTGVVQSFSLAGIRALDACSKRGPQWPPCQVPLAEEVLDHVRGRGFLILDLKGPWPTSQIANLIAMVRARQMIRETMVTSFEMSYLTRVLEVSPRVTLGWLQGTPKDPSPVLALGNAAVFVEESAIRLNASSMPSLVDTLAAHGSLLGAFTFYTSTNVVAVKNLGARWFASDIPLDKSLISP